MPHAKPYLLPMALLGGLLCWHSAMAAEAVYPDHTVHWVAPSTPGDGPDTVGRLLANKVGAALGQSVVIDNRPGAGGVVGAESVAKALPDGYTFLVGNAGSNGINAAIYSKLRYDVEHDFVPVALICLSPNVMVVNAETAPKTVAEFVANAKAHPGQINYASGGVGSSAHMSAELFNSVAGIQMTHVPYKGSSPAIAGVMGGQAQVMIGNLPPWMGLIKAGKARALAVTTPQRDPRLPDVPALAEIYPGFQTQAWFGIFAPKGTPDAVVRKLNAVINQSLQQADVKTQLETMACDPAAGTPEQFAARVHSDIARWKSLSKEKNIRAD